MSRLVEAHPRYRVEWLLHAVIIAAAFVLAIGCSGGGEGESAILAEPAQESGEVLPAVPEGSHIDAETRLSMMVRVDNGYNAAIVVGFVDADGTEFFSYGTTSFTEGAVPDEDTVFEIGSVTKVFTTAVLANMVVGLEVLLEDPIGLYLPGDLATEQSTQGTALIHLATHTSGLPRLPDNLPYGDSENPYADYTLDHMYEFIAGHVAELPPGAQYEYSNYGVGLLGQLLANRATTGYESLLAQRITGPLGMDDTRIELTPSMRSRLAPGHSGVVEVKAWDLGSMAPAGGLHSTARDLLTFVAANVGLKETPLSGALGAAHQMIGSTGIPNVQIALGWHVLTGGEYDIVWHNGETGGYHSFIAFVPDAQTGVVVLSNSHGAIDDIGFHLLDSSNGLEAFSPDAAVDSATLESYTGKYELEPQLFLDVEYQNGHLTARVGSAQRFTFHAVSETDFFSDVAQTGVRFVKDDQGKVVAALLERGDDQTRARRLDPDEQAVEARTEISVAPEVLESYAGVYKLSEDLVFDVTVEDGKLMVKVKGQPRFQVYAESETDFFYKVIDAQISFSTDEEGNAFALVLHQDGQDHIAVKER